MEPNLIVVFLASFSGVFLVLVFLAIAMYILMRLFPAKAITKGPDDAPVYAAIVSTYAHRFPGTRIGKIEEIKNR